ncbi:MAG: discoidin domain-containing protein [Sphingomonadaceae bacterium]
MKTAFSAIALMASLLFAGSAAADVNVAPLGTASASSELSGWNGGAAAKGIDGVINGNYYNPAGIVHTNANAQEWWQVQLNQSYTISGIDLYNRTDGYGDRLNDFTVSIYNNNVEVFSHTYANFTETISGTDVSGMHIDVANLVGDRVKVQLNGQNYLQLAEVSVSAVPEPETYAMMMIGLGLLGLQKRRQNRKFDA